MYNSSLDVIFRVCGLWAKDSCGEGHIAGNSDWNASMPRHTGLCSETIKKRDDTHDNHEMPLCP